MAPRKTTERKQEQLNAAKQWLQATHEPFRRVIEVPSSKKEKGVRPYVVDLNGPHGHTCDCADWMYRRRVEGGHCKHIDAALEVMSEAYQKATTVADARDILSTQKTAHPWFDAWEGPGP